MSKINPKKLLLTSEFFSIQGEGISSGIPAYFLRMAICNLNCGMSKTFFNKLVKENKDLSEDEKMPDGHIFKGDLHENGSATWTCDSTSQWAIRGVERDFQYLIDKWKEEKVYDDILNGNIHLIWTGGEPTIKRHQESIVNFFKYWIGVNLIENGGLFGRDLQVHSGLSSLYSVFNEIETNGTNYIEDDLFNLLNQINCSPKLSNSGQEEKQRIVPDALRRIMQHKKYQFKFVISTEDDVKEIFKDFIEPYNIPLKKVVCMPGLDNIDDFEERTRFVMEMAKKYKFRGLTRLHVAAWNQLLNV